MQEKIEVSIVMPCLREAETIGGCIEEAFHALRKSGVSGEVIVADNGSTDGSVQIACNAGARVIHVPRKGYGNALKAGIEAALGTYVMMGDSDGSYDFGELSNFLNRLRQGDDLVMGCRFPRCGGRIEPGAMRWKHRWIGNPVLSGLGKLFFSSPVDDFHCGLRAFRKEAVLSLNLQTGGMEFASEMVLKATLFGLRISQVPITLRPDGRSRPSHLRSWRDGWRHLRFMLLYSPRWLFLYPGLLLTLSGAAGFVLLLPSPLTIRGVTFDLNSLLVCSTTLLIGFQLFAFGAFIRAYAASVGLLPGGELWLRVINGQPVEWGIAAGLLFFFSGLGYLAFAVLQWKEVNFGPLPYQDSLRMVISAVTGLGLGIQAFVFGFAMAVLGLQNDRRRH